MKIGIYGGAFNPIHYGHLRTAEDILEMLSLDRVLFVPSGITPFDKPDLAGATHRLRMVEAAIEGNDHFALSDIEAKSNKKSYTVETLRQLKSDMKDAALYFILGIDAFLDMPLWKDPHVLVSLVNIVVISRPGYCFADLAASPYISDVPAEVLSQLDGKEGSSRDFYLSPGSTGSLCPVTSLNISATDIRSRVAVGKSIRYLLPDSVKSYIIASDLYQSTIR